MTGDSTGAHAVLRSLGWTEKDNLTIADGSSLGRVSTVHGANAEVIWINSDAQEVRSLCTFATALDLSPVAGDWVGVRAGHIVSVCPRRTSLRRPQAHQREAQVLAANVDVVLLVLPIDREVNLRMLERLAIMAWDSGAQPFVVLSKADGSKNIDSDVAETALVVPGLTVLAASSLSGHGIGELRELLHQGVTAVMLGASGTGKTSLLNALEGTQELTRSVSRSGEGRHATTTRKLYRLSCGGVLLDIPGIRLLDLMVALEGLNETFADIVELAQQCRFRDCSHAGDEGCAVQRAVESGALTSRRLESWRTAQVEIDRSRPDPGSSPAQRRRRKASGK